MAFKPDSFAAITHQGLNEGSVAGSNIKNGARRQHPVKTFGKCRACLAKYRVSYASEPTGGRTVPAAVRFVELR